jgi:hypothetical protein
MWFGVTLIMALLVGYSRMQAQPKGGDWKVPTRFGQFVLSVNSDGTQIIKLATTFSNYTFGGITQNGTVTSQPSPGWPISNRQFTLTTSINPTGTIKLTISGIFIQSGDQASGTWSMLVSGQTDAATWGPVILPSVEDAKGGVPERFSLAQNYPNPFNPSTTIAYELPRTVQVSLNVYNTLGLQVAALVNESKSAGMFTVQFDAGNLTSGVYFYRLQARPTDGGQAGEFVETMKLILVK